LSRSKILGQRSDRQHLSKLAGQAALIATMLPATVFGQSVVKPRVITIHAARFEFKPSAITLHVGERTKLIFVSDDVDHGISVDGLPIDIEIHKGLPGSIVITPEKVAELTGMCSIYCGPGHSQMLLTIHVVNQGWAAGTISNAMAIPCWKSALSSFLYHICRK